MKKIILLSTICVLVFSCSKNNTPAGEPHTTPAILLIKGTLHYDNFPDGWGLYYQTDNDESLILKNNFPSAEAQYEFFKAYVNRHTELSYRTNGETGCLQGIGPSCGHRMVDPVSLKTE